MHKYDIVNNNWSQNINIFSSKVELYTNRLMNNVHDRYSENCVKREIVVTHMFLDQIKCTK